MTKPNQNSSPVHHERSTSRRDFLARAGGGFGAVALASLLSEDGLLASPSIDAANPLAARASHHRTPVKSVIYLFMDGGPSHLDTFDPKPALNQHAGKPLPASIKPAFTPMGVSNNPLLASKRKWKKHGESGIQVSDWMPHVAQHVDEMTIIRSCWADGLNHVGSVCQMNTGSILAGRPSLGSWVTYGLGNESRDLPAFVVMLDNLQEPPGGPRNWGTGFMNATFQGTRFRQGPTPILNLAGPDTIGPKQQRSKLDLLADLNRRHAARRRDNSELEARIASYELAFRMQSAAPEAVDLSRETAETKKLYGLNNKLTQAYGRNCLLARRLVERGVRFVQLYAGSGSKWDAHTKIEANHTARCGASDLPIAGLLTDLKRRGLLESTLVIWGGEFGRTPMSEKGDGRDHNPYGFTIWLAGGGLPGGRIIGATDAFGMHAVEDRAHVLDLHATILHLIGLDHNELTYMHNGLEEKLTRNIGEVIEKVVG